MTSMLCVKEPGGSIEVHHNDVVEELMIDANDHIKTMLTSKAHLQKKLDSKRPKSTPNPTYRGKGVDSDSLIGHTLKLQDWLSEKSVKEIQERADIEARDTKKMYNSVLDVEDNFVKDIDAFLAAKEVHDLRKKEILHKKWNDQVHEPIRKEVIKEMGGPAYKQLDRRKRQIYKEYLEFTNQKGHVFLDTVDPAEYCPLGLHVNRPLGTRGIHAETKPLRDPLLSQAKERAEEDRTILRCTTGITYTDKDIEKIKLPPLPLVPLGRHGTECKTWLAMPMHEIESPVRKASRGRMRGDYNHSQFNFAQWAKMPFHPAIVDEELQSQRKRLYTVHPPYTLEQTDILVESPARLTLPPNKLACSV